MVFYRFRVSEKGPRPEWWMVVACCSCARMCGAVKRTFACLRHWDYPCRGGSHENRVQELAQAEEEAKQADDKVRSVRHYYVLLCHPSCFFASSLPCWVGSSYG